MQNYNQAPQGYQRPGSTASFAGQQGPAPPPPYGAPQGFQATSPPAQSQWAPPAQNQQPVQQQWNQSPQQQQQQQQQQGNWVQPPQQQAAQQGGSGYNPGLYGAMPGAYNQGQGATVASQYPPQQQQQQQDLPPPPPPKPQGFAAAVQQQAPQQQNQQTWPQQPAYSAQQQQQSFQSSQQNTGFTPQGQQGDFSQQGQQGGYPQQQGGFQNQGAPQQPYNSAAPPPPSQTPGGSYFPPSQGRPTSIYGADQAGAYSNPSSAVTQQPPNSVLSPNEQHPAYIPPSLTGQGVQSYMPSNTNPMPGVYVPPPPDIPAWQQAQHAPLQGGKKFKYTKPNIQPAFQPQGYQGQIGMQPQPQMQQGQFGQQPGQPLQQQQPFNQPVQNQFQPQPQPLMPQPGQFGQSTQPQQQQQFGQPMQPQGQFQQAQQPQQLTQSPQGPQLQQTIQQFPQQGQQWPTPPADQAYAQPSIPPSYGVQQPVQQQGWQQGHQAQGSVAGQQYPHGPDQGIQAPKPINGHTGNTPPNFVTDPSPQSQPVSPVQNRHSMSFSSAHAQSSLGRTGSVSSIALGALRNQNRIGTSSVPPAAPTPPPPQKPSQPSALAASALGSGGPSDWEHFGHVEDEIDDEDIFGAKKDEKKNEPAQLDSVELPVHPSPPSTVHEWPTPPPQSAQPAPLNVGIQRRDTYQPTPPPKPDSTPTQAPSEPPSQGFVMDEGIVVANTTASPPPAQVSHPTPAQQNFVMDDGWAPPKQSTPQQQQQPHPPPPTGTTFTMDDGGWAAQSTSPPARQQTPAQQQPPRQLPADNAFVMDDGGWSAAQQTPTQASTGWGAQPKLQKQNFATELKDNGEDYERLKLDMQNELAALQTQIDVLKAEAESSKSQAEAEKSVLSMQIESMKADAEQARSNSEAANKEKDITIERLKEEIEGKHETILERDATIADLKRQLESEKQKEVPKPAPADLVPDINPWYAGSLERYIAMLRSEAGEPQVEEKIKVFTGFLAAESRARGLDYYSTLPAPVPVQEPVNSHPIVEPEPTGISRGASNASAKKPAMHIQMPQQTPVEDIEEPRFSPGGRPIVPQRQPTLKSNDSVPTEQSFIMASGPEPHPQMTTPADSFQRSGNSQPLHRSSTVGLPSEPSSQASTILTPTSSADDDFNKTPIQSPPEEQPQPQYVAFKPSAAREDSSTSHRQSVSFGTPSFQTPSSGHNNDEIFFGQPQPSSKPTSRPTTSASKLSDVPVPAPLSVTPTASVTKKNAVDILADLLPKQTNSSTPCPGLEEIRKSVIALPSEFTYITELTASWEKSAAQVRSKNDAARRARQEKSEARTDELFNDNEISYADIGAIEDEFKEKERELKAQEDRDEYKEYVKNVFDKVYDGLQDQIKHLMEAHVSVEALLLNSVAVAIAPPADLGEGSDVPSTKDCLELLQEIHMLIEVRHEKVVAAVADRDKRYKKTEIQPLYAAGNIGKMKQVERHFENAERQAVLRAKGEKAERVGELVRVCEDCVVRAVGGLQGHGDRILNAVRGLDKTEVEGRGEEVLERASQALGDVKQTSKDLLSLFNALEIELNSAVLEAEIAQARVENSDGVRAKELEIEMVEGEKKLKEEFQRRVGVLDQDKEAVERLFEEKGLKVVLSEEQEKQLRLKMALEEAKKRNGAN
ncbi:uncharacterized protein BDR25DRAFT_391659 [Lindgomyces ingoldianus]|uniref:Uncharacterized protein n=1 Tax=Lindgomyces ingoldianus TaxID=673940 RepID=A0ACB6R5S9_9PLEO|nr:uncharacterized protein BDR25DRAFT_391659 [Lindgomyces ingoldianus]KAF2474526.1 hypothetical protein BDR25DRAFT_391659 [Lindgomyces ingoldianus]